MSEDIVDVKQLKNVQRFWYKRGLEDKRKIINGLSDIIEKRTSQLTSSNKALEEKEQLIYKLEVKNKAIAEVLVEERLLYNNSNQALEVYENAFKHIRSYPVESTKIIFKVVEALAEISKIKRDA